MLDGPGSISRYFQFYIRSVFLCITYFLMYFSVHYLLVLLILYSVLLMYYYIRIVHCLCNTATGYIGPVAVGNKYIIYTTMYVSKAVNLH
jgi:hypothetical protein